MHLCHSSMECRHLQVEKRWGGQSFRSAWRGDPQQDVVCDGVQVIDELDEKKKEALRLTWDKVTA